MCINALSLPITERWELVSDICVGVITSELDYNLLS